MSQGLLLGAAAVTALFLWGGRAPKPAPGVYRSADLPDGTRVGRCTGGQSCARGCEREGKCLPGGEYECEEHGGLGEGMPPKGVALCRVRKT